jgi:hypothetical protein
MNEKERMLHEKALKKALTEQQSLLEAANEKTRYNICTHIYMSNLKPS